MDEKKGPPAGAIHGMGSADGVKLAADIGRVLVRTVAHQRTRRDMEDTRRREETTLHQQVAAPPPVHGSARWAPAPDLRAAGLLRSPAAFDNPSSILLGGFAEHPDATAQDWLHWDGEGHLLTVAPTRSGKSTTLIIPNLLRYRGSCVVLDPKGELYEATSSWRATLGPVHRIAPFAADTDGFNPLSAVRSGADARALADLMIPEDPRAQEYFRKDAIAFLNGVIQYVCDMAPTGRRTLAEVRRITAQPVDGFIGTATAMAANANATVANAGNIVLGKNRERGLPSLRDTLNSELSLWDDDGIAKAISRSDVDFHALKDRPGTVYITIPFDKMAAFAPFQRVLLATALDAMVQNGRAPSIPVLFILDEFLSLGPFHRFRDAIRTHAGAGVRLWFFLQNLATLEEHYPTSWRAFFDAAVRQFFGTSDPFTAATISEMAGETTVAHETTSFTLGRSLSREDFFDTGSTDSLNVTRGVNLTGRRLITPAEVVQRLSGTRPDGTREAVVAINGVPPISARLVPYYLGTRAAARVGRRP